MQIVMGTVRQGWSIAALSALDPLPGALTPLVAPGATPPDPRLFIPFESSVLNARD